MRYSAFFPHSHKIKRHLFLGRTAMTNLDITLPTKVCTVKAMVFPVVMYGCESWTIKKDERIDAFELCCWRRLYTWTSPDVQYWNQIDYILCSQRRRSSIQSAKTRPGADCDSDHKVLIAKFRLKLKKFGKTTGLERLKAGGERDDRGRDGWMASLTQWTWVWVSSGSWWWTGRPVVLQSIGSQRVGHDWVTELNWSDSPLHTYITFSLSSHQSVDS